MKFKKRPRVKALEMVIEMQFQKEPLMFEQAKQCALIAVKNILVEYAVLQIETSFCYQQYLYWEEVKNEIEKI